jgi:hypothetical protein
MKLIKAALKENTINAKCSLGYLRFKLAICVYVKNTDKTSQNRRKILQKIKDHNRH